MPHTEKGRTIAERAWSAAEGFGTIGVAQADLKGIIENEFADVVESDERVRELVAAARSAQDFVSGFTDDPPKCAGPLEAALKKFE